MKLKISALLVTLVALTQMILTLGCGSSKNSNNNNSYRPYPRYHEYRGHRHENYCAYDATQNSYAPSQYYSQNNSYDCGRINNHIHNYNTFTPYYYYGCSAGFYPVYMWYGTVCAPMNYYNSWLNYIATYPYVSFGVWWGFRF